MVEYVRIVTPDAFSRELCHGVVLTQLRSMSMTLRYHLTVSGFMWEEIPGCYPWLQVELTPEEFIYVLLKYEVIDADLLD